MIEITTGRMVTLRQGESVHFNRTLEELERELRAYADAELRAAVISAMYRVFRISWHRARARVASWLGAAAMALVAAAAWLEDLRAFGGFLAAWGMCLVIEMWHRRRARSLEVA